MIELLIFTLLVNSNPFGKGSYRAGASHQIEEEIRDRERIIIYEGGSVLPTCRKYPLPPSVTDSIWYDDGELGGGMSLPAPARMAVRFTPPFYPFKFDGIRYCLHPAIPEATHILHFYQGDSGGAPDSIPVDLITPITQNGLSEGWQYIDISDSNIVITFGDLYGVIEFIESGPSIGLDTDPSHIYDRYWDCFQASPPFDWEMPPAETPLIRAYGEIAYHTDYNVQPLKIVYPTGWDYPDSQVVPQVIVRNFGDSSATNFNVICRIDSSGNTVYNETQTVTKVLEPLTDTVFITFPSWTTGQEDNIYDISFYTSWFLDTLNEYDTLKMRDTTKYLVKAGEIYAPLRWWPEDMIWDGTYIRRIRVEDLWPPHGYYLTKIFTVDVVAGTLIDSFITPGKTGRGLAFGGGDLWLVTDVPQRIYQLSLEGAIIDSFAKPGNYPRGLCWDDSFGCLWLFDTRGEVNKGVLYKLDTLGNVLDSIETKDKISWCVTAHWLGENNTVWVGQDAPSNIVKKFRIKGDSLELVNQYDIKNDVPGFPTGICFDGTHLWMGTEDDDTLRKFAIYGVNAVEEELPGKKQIAKLFQNYPNPFVRKTVIRYTCPCPCKVSLKIYDVAGRLVKSFQLVTNHLSLTTAVSWDGRDESGEKVASGVYFYKLRVGEKQTITKKAIVLR
ncbi:T9SS type A sorting domain-containing protein [candidate division WOR-3 bacterium]|nr:T9SS type A sorting domain-containing protein [candidate division WOR-3 bacterium]